MTIVEERTAPAESPPPRPANPLWALLRNSWRQLTSMRTALVLLFLLAVAAIPGSIFPQRPVSPEKVDDYFVAHPHLAPWLDKFGGFGVYGSPWFAAIYLLLFTSLVGCVVPRLREHWRAMRMAPPEAPRRFERLPQHKAFTGPGVEAADVARLLKRRRFRTVVRTQDDGGWTVSAEKGHLKETGNLLFHFALLAVLVGVGFGHWYGWHGDRLLVGGTGAGDGFCDTVAQYDDSTLGPRVSPADLPDFCLQLTKFSATYQTTGQPKTFDATVNASQDNSAWKSYRFTVNEPLRIHHANIHLLGHGYAMELKFTDKYGATETRVVPFLPTDAMDTSEGAAMFPDVNIDPKTNTRDPDQQVGFQGQFLPTVTAGSVTSTFPAENSPALFLTEYEGNLGLDVGTPGSVYALDQNQISSGALKNVSGAQPHEMRIGDSWTLADGSKLQFVGTRPFVTLAIRYDPTQEFVLFGAVTGLIGLILSLFGHRRRVWFRALPGSGEAGGGTLISAGGLPRTDYPGFGDEFDALVRAVARDEAVEEGTP